MTGLDIVTTYSCPSLTCGASVVSVVTFVHVILAALDYTPGYTIDLGMTLNYTVHITVFFSHACISISALIFFFYSWFVGGNILFVGTVFLILCGFLVHHVYRCIHAILAIANTASAFECVHISYS